MQQPPITEAYYDEHKGDMPAGDCSCAGHPPAARRRLAASPVAADVEAALPVTEQ